MHARLSFLCVPLLLAGALVGSGCSGDGPALTNGPVPEAGGATGEAQSPRPVVDAASPGLDATTPPPDGDDASSAGQDTGGGPPPPPDDAGGAADTGDRSDAGDVGDAGGGDGDGAGPLGGPYTCTLVIGILATQQYWADFEKLVDASKWELVWVHSGFVELWADPANAIWKTAITTPCAQNAKTPDRIVFVALNFDFNTLAQWLPPLTAAANNLHAKYPSAGRIELGTFVRAPGNMACPQAPAPRSTISPAEDQAISMVVQTNPGLFAVAPQLEAQSCGDFTSNPPHPTATGSAHWAQEMAQYYGLGQ